MSKTRNTYDGRPFGSGGTGGRPSAGLPQRIPAPIGGTKQVQPCASSCAGVGPAAVAGATTTSDAASAAIASTSLCMLFSFASLGLDASCPTDERGDSRKHEMHTLLRSVAVASGRVGARPFTHLGRAPPLE